MVLTHSFRSSFLLVLITPRSQRKSHACTMHFGENGNITWAHFKREGEKLFHLRSSQTAASTPLQQKEPFQVGKPGTPWRDNVSQMAKECLVILQEEPEAVVGEQEV